MYCIKCGAKLDDDSKFCQRCGTPTQASGRGAPASGGTQAGLSSLGSVKVSSASEPPSLSRLLGMLICGGFAILLIYMIYKTNYCDLEGKYGTTDFFPVTEIVFHQDGSFSADVISGNLTGKYRKQSLNSPLYTLTVTDYGERSGNPVLDLNSYDFMQKYDIIMEKINDDQFAARLEPREGYWDYVGWSNTVVIFYEIEMDRGSGLTLG